MENSKKTITIYGIMVLLFWMALYTYQPQLSVYSETLGAGAAFTGVILSSYGFVQMIVRLPLGIVSDMLKKRKLFVVLGNIITILAAVGLFFAKTPAQLLIFRGLSGAAASAWVTFTVMFSGYFDENEAPEAMAKLMVYNKLGCLLGMILGGLTAQIFNVRASFLLAVAAGIPAALLSLRLMEPDMTDVKPLKLSDLPSVIKNRSLLVFSFMALLMQIIEQGATMGFTPKYAAEYGAEASSLGILSGAVVFGGMAAGIIYNHILVKKVSKKVCIIAGILVYSLATVFLPIVAKTVPMIIFMQFVAGFGHGFCFPLLMGLAIAEIPSEKRGVAMGVFQSVYALGMFGGPLINGVLIERFNTGTSLSIMGCIGALVLLVYFLFAGKTGKSA